MRMMAVGFAFSEWWGMREDTEKMQRSNSKQREGRKGYCHRHSDKWKERRTWYNWSEAPVWPTDDDCGYWEGKKWERMGKAFLGGWFQPLQDKPHIRFKVPYWGVPLDWEFSCVLWAWDMSPMLLCSMVTVVADSTIWCAATKWKNGFKWAAELLVVSN